MKFSNHTLSVLFLLGGLAMLVLLFVVLSQSASAQLPGAPPVPNGSVIRVPMPDASQIKHPAFPKDSEIKHPAFPKDSEIKRVPMPNVGP